jgi:asparagine synthase (glutamine-hydrolysing)
MEGERMTGEGENRYIASIYDSIKKAVLACSSDVISLSGGLDSSIIAYHLKDVSYPIRGISIISKDFLATDLTYCQIISRKFGISLDMVTVSISEILDSIHETIKILGNFNDIEIRNTIVMYFAIKNAKDSGCDGIITGDGADELFAGYNFLTSKNEQDLQKELDRIKGIMHFPTQKIGKKLNVKIESPFLDNDVIAQSEKIPAMLKVGEYGGKRFGKWILRKAYKDKLPKSIVWRDKSPMQDGAGTSSLSEMFSILISDDVFKDRKKEIFEDDGITIRTKESLHYYDIFKKHFTLQQSCGDDSNTDMSIITTKNCPYCKYVIDSIDSKFCRMCGGFPI